MYKIGMVCSEFSYYSLEDCTQWSNLKLNVIFLEARRQRASRNTDLVNRISKLFVSEKKSHQNEQEDFALNPFNIQKEVKTKDGWKALRTRSPLHEFR